MRWFAVLSVRVGRVRRMRLFDGVARSGCRTLDSRCIVMLHEEAGRSLSSVLRKVMHKSNDRLRPCSMLEPGFITSEVRMPILSTR